MRSPIKYIIFIIIFASLCSCDPIKYVPCTFENCNDNVLKFKNDGDEIQMRMDYDDLSNSYILSTQVPNFYQVNKDSLGIILHSFYPKSLKKIETVSVISDDKRMIKFYISLGEQIVERLTKPIYQMDLLMSGMIERDGKSIINDTITVYPNLIESYRILETNKVKKLLKLANKKVDGFILDSVSASYPIYNIRSWKGVELPEFDKIPAFLQVNYSLDYVNIELESIIARNGDDIWRLQRSKDNVGNVFYDKNTEEDCLLFKYLNSIKPDKVYKFFGRSDCIIIEKDSKRHLIKMIGKSYQTCELSDLFDSIEDFNRVVHNASF